MVHIQIDDTTPRIAYTATAAQVLFSIPFTFFSNLDIEVYVNDVLVALDIDYTLTGAGFTGGGTMTLTVPSTVNDSVVIVRDIVVQRTTDFPASGPFEIDDLNTELDKQVAMLQETRDLVARSLVQPQQDAVYMTPMAVTADRAGKILEFDGAGNPMFVNTVAGIASGGALLLASSIIYTPTAPMTAATVQAAIDALIPKTGEVVFTIDNIAPEGWLMIDDTTIGNASSGATHAHATLYQALFVLLWNKVSDTYAPVSTGRGANAAADYAAGKRIALTKMLGRALGVAGAGSGLTARTVGQTFGEETHLLTTPEMPAHTHVQTAHSHNIRGTTGTVPSGSASFPTINQSNGFAPGGASGFGVTDDSTPTNQNTGGGGAHNVMQPTSFLYARIKL